jgi:hypothetical protein
VREATAEIEPATGTVVGVFTTGTSVQVFLLAQSVSPDTWTGPTNPARIDSEEESGFIPGSDGDGRVHKPAGK